VGANGASVVAGKAVQKMRRGESGREEAKEMGWLATDSSGRSRSILLTNSQTNMATHHLQTYAKAMDSEIHVVRTIYLYVASGEAILVWKSGLLAGWQPTSIHCACM